MSAKTFEKMIKGGKLPSGIVPLANLDKDILDDRWRPKNRDILDFPVFRAVLTGQPGSGKSTWIKNIVGRKELLSRPYKKILVVLGSSANQEWTDLGASEDEEGNLEERVTTYVNEMPTEEKLTNNTLLILDDVDLESLSKEDMALLVMVYRSISSHGGVSVALTAHNFTDVPKQIRRCANLFVIHKQPDLAVLKKMIGSRVGVPANKADKLFGLLKEPHDHLVFDMIQGSKYPVRLNSTKKVNFK